MNTSDVDRAILELLAGGCRDVYDLTMDLAARGHSDQGEAMTGHTVAGRLRSLIKAGLVLKIPNGSQPPWYGATPAALRAHELFASQAVEPGVTHDSEGS